MIRLVNVDAPYSRHVCSSNDGVRRQVGHRVDKSSIFEVDDELVMFQKISTDDRFADFGNDECPLEWSSKMKIEFYCFFSISRYDGVVCGVEIKI